MENIQNLEIWSTTWKEQIIRSETELRRIPNLKIQTKRRNHLVLDGEARIRIEQEGVTERVHIGAY